MLTDNPENMKLFNKATECLQENRNDEAVEMFAQLIEREPNNVHFLNGKGSGLMQSGHLDEAEEIFDKSLSIEDNPMAYLNKAIIFSHKNEYDNAIECCNKILDLYPEFGDIANDLKNNYLEKYNENTNSSLDEFNSEAQELIKEANTLRNENITWKPEKEYEGFAPESGEFKKITFWKVWELYELAMKKDEKCVNLVTSYINEMKSEFMQEFMFFDITRKNDFNPSSMRDQLKLTVMKEIFIDKNFSRANEATDKILTEIDGNDLDAISYKGALLFYRDDVDGAIKCFDRLIECDDEIYSYYGEFNKAFVLRRKTMITKDAEYMVQALDIYDKMLKDSFAFEKVKPYQREILDTFQSIMNVPLF